MRAKINLHLGDCMEAMRKMPNKAYGLAICDIRYGIDADKKNSKRTLQSRKSASLSNYYGQQKWDSCVPPKEYFNELFRVSERQIIWGGNYVGLKGGYLYWHKNVTMPTYSQGELAWVSWLNKISFVEIMWHGMLQENMRDKQKRIHPTEKPIALYKWLLKNYAKEGDTILDTHGGSMSIAIACWDMGFDLDLWEIDKDYFEAGKRRFEIHKSQLKMF